jgi:hypothetical protein
MRFGGFFFIALVVTSVNARKCKIIPGDSAWPSLSSWSSLNSSISGRLVKTVPLGSPCYTADEAACEDVKARWSTPDLQYVSSSSFMSRVRSYNCERSEESSSSMMYPIFTNRSCSPFNDIQPGDVCEVGSYVPYAIDVHTPDDVKKALTFAKKHDIRVVIRNTGHE